VIVVIAADEGDIVAAFTVFDVDGDYYYHYQSS
jgi:hypothetical protein